MPWMVLMALQRRERDVATGRQPRQNLWQCGALPMGTGALVMLVQASANRDERHFASPDTLDITRAPNKHLAFGWGAHYCVGAPLARLEGQIALNTLLRRCPGLRLAAPPATLRWRPGLEMNGLVALPVGILSAVKPYSWFDRIFSTLAFIGFSLPTFFTGLLLILLFSITLDWLPFVYRADISATGWQWWWEHIKQSIMPVTVLGLFQGASWMRYVRSAVLDVIRLDYVTTARSKGLAERVVVMKHVVRNALIPVVTLVALTMPAVFGGAIVTEQIFRIPGIGSLLIDAILRNDTPVIMAVTFVLSALVILFNLLADVLYGWLDPRISYR